MKILLTLGLMGFVAIGVGTKYRDDVLDYLKQRTMPHYYTVQVTRGDVASVINSTGTVKPTQSVLVGSFVSGPIKTIFVDFTDEVHKDQVIAKVDPRIYAAQVARDEATLATRQAELTKAEAILQRAINDEERALKLHKQTPGAISVSELDEKKFSRQSLSAGVSVAQAMIREAQANLDNSKANLAYTEIRSPVDGVVVERAVDTGQVVAASFQTPKLFVVAPNLEKEVHVHALVDEADIGFIQAAKRRGEPVYFTVDAHANDLFEGEIIEIRLNSGTTQNVVTYPVVIRAPNRSRKLLPGMTANISFQVDAHTNVLCVPNAALRFFPDTQFVRPQDRPLLDGIEYSSDAADDYVPTADERVDASRNRNRRHLWIVDGDMLSAVSVETGLSNNQFTEIVAGDLDFGSQVVTGVRR